MSILTLPAALNVGIEKFDRDHRVLIDEMNRLHEAVVVRQADAATAVAIAVEAVARRHFLQEERMLTTHRYPLLKRHIAGHAAVLTRLEIIGQAISVRQWTGLADRVEAMMMRKLDGLIMDDLDYCWWFEVRGIVPGAAIGMENRTASMMQ